MTSILSFIRPHDVGSFDPEVVRAMGEAFDAAREFLGTSEAAGLDALASRIVDAARNGERDPGRLLAAGLKPWRK